MNNDELKKLSDLVDTLRGEGGCPWDQEQKARDILSDLVEEVHEFQWAHADGTREDVAEEGGDVLFVLVFAIKLLQEEFPELTLEHLTSRVHEKIIRRHPHVFGDQTAGTKEEGLAHWNRMKAEEKKHSRPDIFSDIPGALPPVRRAEKIQRRAARVGFDWPDSRGIFDKLREEIDELETAIETAKKELTEEEVGDLLFSVINLSRFLNIDSEKALTGTNAKFVRRFRVMEGLIKSDRGRLENMSLEEMDRYWEKAKGKK